ncbi:hypothetical protein Glove_199g48 [Diversispora epigaea]|uniref:BTB domain-containing protein n=1 Tax=Diversispora epigaea TaxID=1348612 RepID=A0A397IUM5_9GLOM|nr:hypothetical protein Glove_199g48 [Diversispora epigaea]
MSFKFFDKLSQDFSELLNDEKEYNVVIEVDKEENMKSFTTHSIVLRYHSSYFDKELENAPANENQIKTIIKPNISFQKFEIILNYQESYLIESKDSWLRTHFSLVYRSILDKGFTSLQETALISILKRDDLQIEEKWSNENFETLKITLHQCLPLIRYFHIPGEVLWEKVKPYKKILEEELWDDIIQHTISPNKSITSIILLARIISNLELPSRTTSTPNFHRD